MVSNNERHFYSARINLDDGQVDGFVKPWFDLDTVRDIAENTQDDAERHGHGSIDTVHVIDGGTENGEPRALVVVITWMDIATQGVERATEIVEPDEHGLYAIGGFPWCWYVLDSEMNPQIPYRVEQ